MDLFSKLREKFAPINVRFLLVQWAKGRQKEDMHTAVMELEKIPKPGMQ